MTFLPMAVHTITDSAGKESLSACSSFLSALMWNCRFSTTNIDLIKSFKNSKTNFGL